MSWKKYLGLLLPLFAFMGCSDLEDTYSDYAGDGEIRYLGQCTDVTLSPGWECLNLKWTNSVDPVIAHIRVAWTINDKTEEVLLDPQTEEYSIEGLTVNDSYEVTVCGVDDEGNASLATTLYGRPYTLEHEVVLNFPQLVAKQFFVKDRLALSFSEWRSEIVSAQLIYTKADGGEGVLKLDSIFVTENPYYLLEEPISDAPVYVERTGILEGDTVELAPLELSRAAIFSAEFDNLLLARFGTEDVTVEQLQSIEEFDIDYSLTSLEDILNLPNLKVLNLGKNRYLSEEHLTYNAAASVLYGEKDASLFALKVAREVLGIEINHYNSHFFAAGELPYVNEMGNPELPALNYISMEGCQFSSTPADEEGVAHLDWLFDGNLESCWSPQQSTSWREHQLVVNLSSMTMLSGVKIVQKSFGQYASQDQAFAPSSIRVQVSSDGVNWNNATYLEEIAIGNTGGEASIIRFPEPVEAAALRFIVNDQVNYSNYGISLAEIQMF